MAERRACLQALPAPSAGDTLDLTCNSLTLLSAITYALSGTQTNLIVAASIIGGTPIEGNFQRGIHIGGGYSFKQTWASGTAGYTLGPNTANGRYYFLKTGAAGGVYEFDGDIFRDGIKIAGTRKTGWATATGTATRTTFDTATVTTAQLAERVKALIDDLHATAGHGMIGS